MCHTCSCYTVVWLHEPELRAITGVARIWALALGLVLEAFLLPQYRHCKLVSDSRRQEIREG